MELVVFSLTSMLSTLLFVSGPAARRFESLTLNFLVLLLSQNLIHPFPLGIPALILVLTHTYFSRSSPALRRSLGRHKALVVSSALLLGIAQFLTSWSTAGFPITSPGKLLLVALETVPWGLLTAVYLSLWAKGDLLAAIIFNYLAANAAASILQSSSGQLLKFAGSMTIDEREFVVTHSNLYGTGSFRYRGLFLAHNYSAAIAGLLCISILYVCRSWIQKLASIACAGIATALTQSRTGFVLLLVVALVVYVDLRKSATAAQKAMRQVALPLILMVVAWLQFRYRFTGKGQADLAGYAGREVRWGAAWNELIQQPLYGSGENILSSGFSTHNLFLWWWFRFGLFGLLGGVCLVLVLFKSKQVEVKMFAFAVSIAGFSVEFLADPRVSTAFFIALGVVFQTMIDADSHPRIRTQLRDSMTKVVE